MSDTTLVTRLGFDVERLHFSLRTAFACGIAVFLACHRHGGLAKLVCGHW